VSSRRDLLVTLHTYSGLAAFGPEPGRATGALLLACWTPSAFTADAACCGSHPRASSRSTNLRLTRNPPLASPPHDLLTFHSRRLRVAG